MQVMAQQKGKGQAPDRIVCPFENLYSILGRIHGDLQKHAGAKKKFDTVRISPLLVGVFDDCQYQYKLFFFS
jgi:hypothetical protein